MSPDTRVRSEASMAMSFRPDGDADVGLCERRRIVDPVAHHRNTMALGLKLLDLFRLTVRKNFGKDAIDAGLARDRFRGPSLSPVTIATSSPSCRSSATASAAPCSIVSAIASTPAARPSAAT